MNIDAKWRRMSKRLGTLPAEVRLAAIDFTRDALDATLAAHGYTTQRRTLFIWESVTQYLDETSVRKALDFLAAAACGSRLVLTYVHRDFLGGRRFDGQDALYRRFVTKHGIWRFGSIRPNCPRFSRPMAGV